MLAYKLIQEVEQHCEPIMRAVLQEISRDPVLTHLKTLPESELRDWGYGILKNLGNWLVEEKDRALERKYEAVGRLRFEESVPLSEALRGAQIVKNKTVDFVRGGGFGYTAFEVYAEEELEYLVGRFFDWLIYHLVHGYEEAAHRKARSAA